MSSSLVIGGLFVKVYISVDMEGASGVTGINDTEPGHPAFERFRKLLTNDVNAAIKGAYKGGARKVVVNDSHYWMRNILIEELHSKAELISGSTKPLTMMEGIDKTFDAVFYIGYHAKAGTQAAVMNHTMYFDVLNIQVNGKSVGEFGINAMVAGHYDVPTVLATGDDKFIAEAVSLIGNLETVMVKKGIDFTVARCLPLEECTLRIQQAAEKALANIRQFQPLKTQTPVTIVVELPWTSMVAAATGINGVTRNTPRSYTFTSQDIVEGYKMLDATLKLAKTASPQALRGVP